MYIPWEDLQLLLSVVEEGSFSGAARRLGLTQPTVSRRIAGLEEELARPLFRRDVEGAHPTKEGAALLPAAQQMARFAAEAERAAQAFEQTPRGSVRIAAPPGTAFDLLVPLAARLRTRYPEISLHLIAGVEHIDLSRGHAELAIRTRRPTSPDLAMIEEVQVETAVQASAEYVARKGQCLLPEAVDWICWAAPNEHLEPNRTLSNTISGFSPAFASSDYLVQQRAVALGVGAMVLPKTYFPEQASPSLVELDVGLSFPPISAYVVCAKAMRWVPRVQLVASALSSLLAEVEGLVQKTGE